MFHLPILNASISAQKNTQQTLNFTSKLKSNQSKFKTKTHLALRNIRNLVRISRNLRQPHTRKKCLHNIKTIE